MTASAAAAEKGEAVAASERKTIGNMNGPWAMAFKAALVLTPVALSGMVWTGYEIVTIKASRFTHQDGQAVNDRITALQAAISAQLADQQRQIDHLPPKDLVDTVIRVDERQRLIMMALDRIEKRLALPN